MRVKAYIHSLKDKEHDRHVSGDAEIIEKIGDNLYPCQSWQGYMSIINI